MTTIELVEVGPRDGLQNESRTLTVDTRVELIDKLVRSGARRVEAVSFVRGDLVPQMADAEKVMAQLPRHTGTRYIGLVLNRKGAERAAIAEATEINIVVPVTDAFSRRNQNASVEEMITHAAAAAAVARDAGMGVSVTLAVAFGCPFTRQVPLEVVRDVYCRAVDIGIDEIAFADTIGVGVPWQVHAMAALVRNDFVPPRIRFHFHNTRNTGYANAYAAARLTGFDSVALDASVGGFGGCPFAPRATGNIASEDLAYLLEREGSRGIDVDIDAMSKTADWLSGQLGRPVQGLVARAGSFDSRGAS